MLVDFRNAERIVNFLKIFIQQHIVLYGSYAQSVCPVYVGSDAYLGPIVCLLLVNKANLYGFGVYAAASLILTSDNIEIKKMNE